MFIKQIPTPSSSPSAGDNDGDQETSSQVRQENPNSCTPNTAPPQTSTATPSPEIDEETLRYLNKVLLSIPRELDDAAAYAELKARLGISRSKNPASSSKPKIPPSSPTSPKPSSIQPSPSSLTQPMQCSADTADKEGLGEDYGQSFAIPSPAGGGGSASVHKPHLTEGGDINSEEEEEFRPLFDYGKMEEEEPLRRQTRRMTTDRLLEVAENLKTQCEEGTVVQKPRTVRRLVDEEAEEPQFQEAGEEEKATKGSLARGKGSILPILKRSRPADTEVAIADASAPASPQPGDKGSDSTGEELRWTRTTRRQQGKPEASPSIAYSPQHVVLTPALRQQMMEFDDPKMQKKVHQRVTSQKKLKAGRCCTSHPWRR
ncbi:uncharacterized protein LOC121745755 [Salvia splendens]|uniref:uncharacterized protein LOC121745755 n=1 Tax=Salvia splendens TaxID=180675 RepID=UPI001C26A918|nr:uncharacterized protein LOC121745755 [Salvia splendens]